MVASPEMNGGWPDLPDKPPNLPQLGPRPTPLELAQAYATLAVHHGQLWPRVVHALEYLRGNLIGAKGEAAAANSEARRLREELEVHRAAWLNLPPMRPESPSTVDMAESIKTKVSSEFEKIAKETKGPHVEADPKRLEAVVGKAVDEELARRDALKKAQENQARLDAIDEAAKIRKKNLRKIILAGMCAFAAAGGAWAWGKAQGHLEGHAEGIDDARKVMTAVAAAPSAAPPVSAAATTVPAQAPASAVRAR